jgi:hypothetical protein
VCCTLPDRPVCLPQLNTDAGWSEEVLSWCSDHLPKPQHVPLQRSTSQPGTCGACTTCAEQQLAMLRLGSRGMPHLEPQIHDRHVMNALQQQRRCSEEQHGLPTGLQLPQQLFRGLRVRMAVASGIADSVHLHKVTRRVEYNGTVMPRVQAVADAPEGGHVSSSSSCSCCMWWLAEVSYMPYIDRIISACFGCGWCCLTGVCHCMLMMGA